MEKSVREQVMLLISSSPKVRTEAAAAIQKYGRFSEPILKRLVEDEKDAMLRARLKRLIDEPATD